MDESEIIELQKDLLKQLRHASEMLSTLVLNAPMKPNKATLNWAEEVERINYQLKLIVDKT